MEPSQKAIDFLIANPETANFFDEKYGQGSASKILSKKEEEKQSGPLSAKDVASGFVRTIVPSTGKMIGELVHAITSPLQTAQGIMDIGAGALQNIVPTSVKEFIDRFDTNPQAAERAVQIANAVGGEYKQKYGTMEGFKRALATDPATVLADLSTIATGGAALAGRVAPVGAAAVRQAASFIDPLSLIAKGVSKTANVVPKAVSSAIGATTGVGSEPISQAYRAGKEGGQVAQSFLENLRGKADMQDVLDIAKSNLDAMRKQRSDIYKANMQNIKNDATVLDFAGIDKAVNQAFDTFTFKGKPKNELAIAKLEEVKSKIDEWKNLNPTEYHTPEGLDALKQTVGQVLEDLKPRTPSDVAVKGVYNAIKDEITKQAPTYAKTMKSYSDATDLIREVERSLSLGDKVSADTAMRKLQSVMRNNVNTNYGQRMALMKELESVGGKEMMPALAGQAMSDIAPRGIQRAAVPINAILGFQAGGLPTAAIGAVLSSPRAMGEASYYAGKAAAIPSKAVGGLLDLESMLPQSLQISGRQFPSIDASTLNLLYQLRQREEENR